MQELAFLSVPITKRSRNSDGSVIVEGKVTDDSLDLDGQIVDPETAAVALQEWFDEYANVRQQHSSTLPPAGKGIALKFRDGSPYLTAKIVEPTAAKLVNEGVYQAFSIGIADGRLDTSPQAKRLARNGILYPSLVNEVSVVDYPANTSTKFLVAKRRKDGHPEDVLAMEVMDRSLRGLDGDGLVKALKRRMDPDVGGGVDRDKIPAEDFGDPKRRKYPIVTPKDVHDAAILAGVHAGPKVKARIIAIAERKGPKFAAELPNTWKAGMAKKSKAKKSPGLKDGPPEMGDKKKGKPAFPGAAPEFTKKPKAKKTKAAKGKIPKVDQDVTEDLDKVDEDVKQTIKDQAADNAGHESGDDKGDADKVSKRKRKLSKAARRMAKHAARARSTKALKVTKAEVRAMQKIHDTICPACAHKAVKRVKDIVDPGMFADHLTASGAARLPAEIVAAQSDAYMAASHVAQLARKDFDALRRVAQKSFMDSYPDLRIASPDLTDPSSFQRGFLPSAAKETASTMDHPSNFPKTHPLAAGQFKRPALTVNEARPSLVGGHSAASMVHTKAYGDGPDGAAMAILHDHVTGNYPVSCPAGAIANEVTDRLGTPGEMYTAGPTVTPVDVKAGATLSKVVNPERVTKAMRKQVRVEVAKATKSYQRRVKDLERQLERELARPDVAKAARRMTEFAPTHKSLGVIDESKRERVARAKRLSERIHSRNGDQARAAVSELQDFVSPAEFAAIITADGEN